MDTELQWQCSTCNSIFFTSDLRMHCSCKRYRWCLKKVSFALAEAAVTGAMSEFVFLEGSSQEGQSL